MSGEVATTEDNVPKGLVVWREAVGRAHTSAQLAMALYMLEASIAWDKSIMKAVSSVSSASGKGSSVGIRLILLYHSFCHRFSSLPIPHLVTCWIQVLESHWKKLLNGLTTHLISNAFYHMACIASLPTLFTSLLFICNIKHTCLSFL